MAPAVAVGDAPADRETDPDAAAVEMLEEWLAK